MVGKENFVCVSIVQAVPLGHQAGKSASKLEKEVVQWERFLSA